MPTARPATITPHLFNLLTTIFCASSSIAFESFARGNGKSGTSLPKILHNGSQPSLTSKNDS